jgi:hypothetical protein
MATDAVSRVLGFNGVGVEMGLLRWCQNGVALRCAALS